MIVTASLIDDTGEVVATAENVAMTIAGKSSSDNASVVWLQNVEDVRFPDVKKRCRAVEFSVTFPDGKVAQDKITQPLELVPGVVIAVFNKGMMKVKHA